MLPMLTVSGAPGLLYLNGRFCGETGTAAMPLAREGVQYLELRPFDPDRQGAVLRLNIRDGRLTDGVTGDVFAVQWPNGWIALEMKDAGATVLAQGVEPRLLSSLDMPGGRYLLVDEGGTPTFGRNAEEAVFLDACGIRDATLRPLPYPGLCAVEGTTESGRFVAVLRAEDAPEIVHFSAGASARLDAQGVVHCVEPADDLVGHANVCVFSPDAQGNYALRSRDPVWLDGAPRWPSSPADTARAWLEALRFGAREEARGYLLRPEKSDAFERVAGAFDAVTGLPEDGAAGVRWGALSMAGDNLASVRRLDFAMLRHPSAQGEWKIENVWEATCD